MPKATCIHSGCDKPAHARGYCSAHYCRWKRWGDPDGVEVMRQPGGAASSECAVESCASPGYCRGWCIMHYQRWRQHGSELHEHRRDTNAICAVDGCLRTILNGHREWCLMHYARWHRHGVAEYVTIHEMTEEERLFRHINVGDDDECWPWTGPRDEDGYGKFAYAESGHRYRRAHRVAWELAHDESVPEGLIVRHTCDVPPCCNDRHLTIGTTRDNVSDKIERNRQPRGEELYNTRLTERDVKAIRDGYTGVRGEQAALADHFKVSRSTIWTVVHRKTWRHTA